MFKLSYEQNNILILIILSLFIGQVFFTSKEGNSSGIYNNGITENDLNKIYQKRQNSLNLIDDLDEIQKTQIQELIDTVNDGTVSDIDEEVRKRIQSIDYISKQKRGTYEDLSSSLTFLMDRYGQSRADKSIQDANATMIKQELNDLKEETKQYKDNLSEKQKKTQINTYYLKRYQNLIQLTQTLCIYIFVIIIVMVLHVNELLGDNIKIGIMGIIIAVAIIHLGKKIVDFYFRNNMNFDEYDWPFNSNRDYGDGEPITVGYGDDDDDECEASNS
tara:strand:- start:5112 stop:5936 length:825 start_codon:yes stop_codon:yes gene_type:complete